MAAETPANRQHEWWQKGIIYQIYPRSFADSNGDGVGDLPGVISRLDYLSWLGVDAIWLSPIYPSPMADFGYDISDYCNIHPLFGTLEDFDKLLAEAHRRDIRVILDFVPNHTSDQHPWFKESRASRHNPKRDWYIWRDPAPGGGPPNNWLSNFGGSAWALDDATGQYYYHAFLKEQPDVNWRNPQLRNAMHDVLRFWLERGVDGFRVDVIWHIVKDSEFRDNPRNPGYQPGQNPHHEVISTYEADRPEVHDIIAGMRKVLDSYPSRMMVGEVYLPIERMVAYYGEGGAGEHMPFNFQLITLPWNVHTIANAIATYEKSLPSYGWPNWVLGNHDNPRIGSRIGSAQARVAAMLLLTLRGTPTMYYGDEICMTDVPIPPEAVQDPFEKNVPGMRLGRDPQRTPMQWDASPNAGFSPSSATTMPWLPIASDYAKINVVAQREDPRSSLNLYRKLIQFRRAEPALSIGSYRELAIQADLLAYERRDPIGVRRFLIVLNFGNQPQTMKLADAGIARRCRVVLSTHGDRADEWVQNAIAMRPDEGMMLWVEAEMSPTVAP
jgi:alpha-glucosidase